MTNRSFGNCKLKSLRCNLWNMKFLKWGSEGKWKYQGEYYSYGNKMLSLTVDNHYWVSLEERCLSRETLCWPCIVILQPSLPLSLAPIFYIFHHFKVYQQRLFSQFQSWPWNSSCNDHSIYSAKHLEVMI